MLYVPEGERTNHYISIEQLPVKVHQELTRRFDEFRSETSTKKECYLRLSTNCATYVEKPFCVCDQLSRGLRTDRVAPQTFHQGGEFTFNADDWCIRKRLPCTHIIEVDDSYALCFLPLPNAVKTGVSWK